MRIFLTILLAFALTQGRAQAVIDLSGHDFAAGKARLSGQWEFYWGELLTPEDIQSGRYAPDLVRVPSGWNRDVYSGLGKATYRVTITLPDNRKPDLSFYFPPIRCAARIWVNGILKDSIGVVGDRESYRSGLSGILLSVPDRSPVELVVQVANYDYLTGGIVSGVWVGPTSGIQREINIKSGLDTIFAGSLLAMFVYLIMMFALYRRGYSFLFLALICLAVALRTVVIESGSVLLPQLVPAAGWGISKKIEFFSVYAIVALFPLYVSSVFPTVSKKGVNWVFIGIAGALCATVLVTPQYVYGLLLDVCHAALIAGFIYAIWVISRGLKKRIPDARVLLTGILAAFPFILLEIVKNSSFVAVRIPLTYLVEFGVLTFLLFQVYVLGNHYAKAYQSMEKLVEERTAELSRANRIRDKLLSIISHDIKGPFNSMRGIVSLFNQGIVKGEELGPVMIKIESNMTTTNLLIENVLSWVRDQMSGAPVAMEPVALGNLVEEHIALYAPAAAEKKIKIVSTIGNGLRVSADRHILSLVLRNLISNAIKYSFKDGEITISETRDNSRLWLSICDSGTGMSAQAVQKLLQDDELIMSEPGTGNEMGTGLGLRVSREYLIKMGSELKIESAPGQGSTFRISLVPTL